MSIGDKLADFWRKLTCRGKSSTSVRPTVPGPDTARAAAAAAASATTTAANPTDRPNNPWAEAEGTTYSGLFGNEVTGSPKATEEEKPTRKNSQASTVLGDE